MKLKNKYSNTLNDDYDNKFNEHKNYLHDDNEINYGDTIIENSKEEEEDIMDSDFKKFKNNIKLLENTIKNDTVKALKIEDCDEDIIKPDDLMIDNNHIEEQI